MSRCKKCGCQVESPFDGKTVIHNQEACRAFIVEAKCLLNRSERSKQWTQQVDELSGEIIKLRECVAEKDEAIKPGLASIRGLLQYSHSKGIISPECRMAINSLKAALSKSTK